MLIPYIWNIFQGFYVALLVTSRDETISSQLSDSHVWPLHKLWGNTVAQQVDEWHTYSCLGVGRTKWRHVYVIVFGIFIFIFKVIILLSSVFIPEVFNDDVSTQEIKIKFYSRNI
jgi:hypothetical protein